MIEAAPAAPCPPAADGRAPDAPVAGASGNGPDAALAEHHALLLGAVREATGVADLALDASRHLWLTYRDQPLMLRLVPDPLRVQIHAPVVKASRVDAALLERLNELNGEPAGVRWVAVEQTVVAVVEVLALPMVQDHVVAALQGFCVHVDEHARLLRAEFGVQAFPKARHRPGVLH
jgi:hypothetical protein